MLANVVSREKPYQPTPDAIDQPIYGGVYSVFGSNQLSPELTTSQAFASIRKKASEILRYNNGQNSRALIQIGDIHLSKNNVNQAIEAYEKSLKLDSSDISVYLKIISSLIKKQQLQKANKYYLQLLDRVNYHSKYLTPYIIFRIINFSVEIEDVSETKKIIRTRCKVNDDQIKNAVGLFYLIVDKNHSEAKKAFEAGLKINPNNVDLNNNLGICLRFANKLDEAIKRFQKANYLDLLYPAAYENLASIYYQINQLDKALNILKNAKINHSLISNRWLHNYAMLLAENGYHNEAIIELESLRKIEPKNGLIINNIGVCFERQHSLDQAESYFKKSIEETMEMARGSSSVPESILVIPFVNLSKVYFQKNIYDKAISILKTANKLFKLQWEGKLNLGIAYISTQEYEKAEYQLNEVLKMSPNNVDAIVNLSYIAEEIKFKYQEAIDMLLPYTENSTKELAYVIKNNIAYAYLKLGLTEKAEIYILKDDNTFASLATKGLRYLLKDDLKNAKKMYNKAKMQTANEFQYNHTAQVSCLEFAHYWQKKGNIKKALEKVDEGLTYDGVETIKAQLKDLKSLLIKS